MIAIVSMQRADGTYYELGTFNRSVWRDLTTERGIVRRATKLGKPCRVELYHDERIYGNPYKIIYVGA